MEKFREELEAIRENEREIDTSFKNRIKALENE